MEIKVVKDGSQYKLTLNREFLKKLKGKKNIKAEINNFKFIANITYIKTINSDNSTNTKGIITIPIKIIRYLKLKNYQEVKFDVSK